MGKAIFKVLLKFIKSIVDVILAPINTLVVGLFPNLTLLINTFTTVINRVVGNTLGWFAHILPPTTKSVILLYFAILISYYTISISVHLVLKIIHIIKEVKIW